MLFSERVIIKLIKILFEALNKDNTLHSRDYKKLAIDTTLTLSEKLVKDSDNKLDDIIYEQIKQALNKKG